MAELRTLKHGRLYLLKDGSAFDDFAQANVSSGGLFQKTDGTWGALMEESGDFYLYSGGHPSSIQAATPSASINATNTVSKPVFYNDGSRIHLWSAYDETGTGDYELYYGFSDNDGSSWTFGIDLSIRGDETWLTDDVWPLYFDYEVDGTDAHRLWVVGNNGGTYTLGYVAIDTSGAAFLTSIAVNANYTAQASASWTENLAAEWRVVMTKASGVYHVYHLDGARSGLPAVHLSSTTMDDLRLSQAVPVLYRGVSGTYDDGLQAPYSVAVHQGTFHLLYGGNDSSNTRAMLAVGESPDRLYKVPWMDVDTFGSADLLVDFAADLTFTMPDQHNHVPNRNAPGALIDAPFSPSALSFTFRQTSELSDAASEYGWLAGLASPEAGEDSITANPGELGRLNIAYITENDAGTPSEFYLFPMVGITSLEVSEGADGNTITATGQMHSMQRPLFGSIT